jgi:hypothetical protein
LGCQPQWRPEPPPIERLAGLLANERRNK